MEVNMNVNIDEFWAKVDKTGDCWIWTKARTPKGYGAYKDNQAAHRIAWQLANNRSIPPGMHVLHSCDNPPCVNPAHLRLGTQLDNSRDMVERGRSYKMRKLSAEQRAEIRAKYSGSAFIPWSVAQSYGVSPGTIRKIADGK